MAISDYVSDNVHEFTKLLAKSAHELSKREGDNYKALEDYANKWLEMHGNVVHTGTQLNFGSPQQNQHLFYLLLGLPIRCRTMVQKGSIRHKNGLLGSPATDESAIQFALANDCADEPWKAEFLKALLEYKSAATRTALYWLPYPLWVDENSMIHPGFNSCGTVTRRPTGSKPNLMQVSKSVVRSIVIPSTPDNVIVSIDFSSQELRVLAGMTMDKTLLKAYQGAKPLDLHVLTACGLAPMFLPRFKNEIMSSANPGISFQPQVADNYGSMEASQALVGEFCAKGETFSADYTHIVYESASRIDYDWYKLHYNDDTGIGHFLSTVRGYAKTANFGVAYSAGPATVSMQLMIPLDDSKIIVDSMNTTYPGIPAWKNVVYDQAAKDGYVQTGFGSRRHCGTGLTKGKRWETSRWERQVANYLIQGTCADLLKVVLSKVYKLGVLEKYGAYLIAPIYDELLMECPKNPEILHPFLNEMCDVMEQPIPGICIPMVADCSFGKNWYEQKEVGNRPSLEKVINAVAEIDKSEPVGAIDLTQFIEIEEVEDEEMEYVGE
jgi:DNA polymerase I-like protein with 3'-5' exonuclease and polymerase domains